ncbi:MAG TPA: hypothetical protein VGW36_06005 [Pyrinomonadaceae bacterium]|nr:hypothetical protein [Pyrinomonadaceae bacterium]
MSPRDDARFAFRNPATQREFETEFPHDRHQDVIARLFDFERQLDERPASLFIRASFRLSPAQADEKAYNNCTICHAPRERLPAPPAGGWIDGLAPDNLTFKAVPANHASCFNCHWKSEAPTGNDCAGCHKLTTPHTAVDLPQRISMKFRHDGGGERKNHVAECTTCHINITKSATLRGLKPDVPVTACTECHNKDGLRLDVSNELVAIDKNRDFVCVYCHTSNIGKLDPPASHYLIAERPPKKRQDIR